MKPIRVKPGLYLSGNRRVYRRMWTWVESFVEGMKTDARDSRFNRG